jgi:pimeloyl-ACP methyl ester carboxylesterase
MVHGTFSRTHLAFGQLPRDYVEALHRHYEGRVFAFDHPFLSEDPADNARWLLSQIPVDEDLTVDIVCHSRGGLVSRVLSEKRSELPVAGRLRVGKLVLVGVPNAGTALADPDHIAKLLDVFTNLINFVPDSFGTPALTLLVECAKAVAVGAVGGLTGLQAMRPGGEFATWLNQPGHVPDQTKYFAVTSKVTPTEPGLKHLALSRTLDRLLRGANDFVVPTEGVFSANGSGYFPVDKPLVLGGRDAVAHTKYFTDSVVRNQIFEWLTAP